MKNTLMICIIAGIMFGNTQVDSYQRCNWLYKWPAGWIQSTNTGDNVTIEDVDYNIAYSDNTWPYNPVHPISIAVGDYRYYFSYFGTHGETWANMFSRQMDYRCTSVAVRSLGANFFESFVGTEEGVIVKSNDHYDNDIDEVYVSQQDRVIESIDFENVSLYSDPEIGIAVGYNGSLWNPGQTGFILRTVDGGETWNEVSIGSGGQIHIFPRLYCVKASSKQASDYFYVGGALGRVYVSSDGGENWTIRRAPVDEPILSIDTKFPEGDICLAVSTEHILRSTDNGTTWTIVYDDLTSMGSLTSVCWYNWDYLNYRAYAVGGFGKLLYSGDSGANWTDHTWIPYSSSAQNQFLDIASPTQIGGGNHFARSNIRIVGANWPMGLDQENPINQSANELPYRENINQSITYTNRKLYVNNMQYMGSAELLIYDTLGRVRWSSSLVLDGTPYTCTIPENLHNGLYIACLVSEGEMLMSTKMTLVE